MKQWCIKYWYMEDDNSPVEAWLDSLAHEQLKSVAKEMKLLERCGNELRLPHSRALGKGLFELRERRFGYRVYYTFFEQSVILLLNAGNKSSQTNDIKIARGRLNDLQLGVFA